MKQVKVVEIYFADISEEKQKELLKLFRVNSSEEMNWNLFPITLIEEPEHEDGESIQLE